ncbi:MAG TPA: choice-of-anchor D domain-containing protein [Candidatus Polarisedimenticolia bacterium]|nr:choice-of-anchor D domain-containing protein [Candidatus Polarisedimenticolia bacterium]
MLSYRTGCRTCPKCVPASSSSGPHLRATMPLAMGEVASPAKARNHPQVRRVRRGLCADVEILALAIALVGMLGSVGCVGLSGTPSSGGTSTGGGTSGGGGGTSTGGSAAGQLSASSTSINFGNVTVGTSTAQLITLTDTGSANVTISSVSATGSGFSASGASNVILTPNQSVTVSVNFSPTTAGGVTGQLSISSNATNSLLQVALSGTGVAPTVQHSVTLNWQPSTSQVIGYFVYRGAPSGGALSKLNASAEPSTTYTDSSVAGGQSYVYAVSAVDSNNVESAYSNQVSVTVPSP